MWGFFWGQVAPFRAASCLLVNKKNYLLPSREAGGGLEGTACLPTALAAIQGTFLGRLFYLLVNRSNVGLFLGTSGAFQGRLLSFGE
ncbi:MAG: hypothetical protein IPO69_23145 [Saprospiraceae bacterium]|nr:hypothetical protein [Saprospiraceae bacterium]